MIDGHGMLECPCGDEATTTVEVEWMDDDNKARYQFCERCAADVEFAIEGATVVSS